MILADRILTIPLALDPTFARDITAFLLPSDEPYKSSSILADYLRVGPVAPPTRRPDGSGEFHLDVNEGTVRVVVPAGTTWVELRGRWSADDEDDLAMRLGPVDPLGGIVAEQIAARADLARALRVDLGELVDDWLAAHRVELAFVVDEGESTEEGQRVRREAALRDLAERVARHVDAPSVAGRVQLARNALAALDGEHALVGELQSVCDDLDRIRPRQEADFDADELIALRRKRKRDRRMRREMARANLVRFIGVGWDEQPPEQHWDLFEMNVPEALKAQLVDEIVSHVMRIATLPPKRWGGWSPPSG